MTQQEMFDRVALHLLRQGRRSVSRDLRSALSNLDQCAYRGNNGTRCAIGVLIPDERYSPDLEGRPCSNAPVREAAGISNDCVGLAKHLQGIHDVLAVETWPGALRRAAALFDLDAKVVDAFERGK